MAVKIKLKRLGKIRNPQYRIIVADARTKRDGRAIEEVGLYHPKEEPSLIKVNGERVAYWLSVGAQPTDAVRAILKVTGDWQKFTGEPGAEGTLKVREEKADKLSLFNEAVADGEKAKDEKPEFVKKAEAKAAEAAEAETATEEAAEADTATEGAAGDAEAATNAAEEAAEAVEETPAEVTEEVKEADDETGSENEAAEEEAEAADAEAESKED